jgi:dihydrolipoamide dehydrogenase
MADYDLVVLGGGPGGYAAAFRAALLGLKVALVERDKVGGTCLHRGCIPTKALLHAAELMDSIREAPAFGIKTSEPEVDWTAVQAAKAEPVKKLYAGLSSVVKHRKVDLIQGDGRIGERGVVMVGDQQIAGKAVILAPGSFARSLPGIEPDGRLIMTSDHALVADRLPASVAVIGAGAVGVEFASMYRSFGSEVTLIEALPRAVPLEDPEISKELAAAFAKRGISVNAGAVVQDVQPGEDTVKLTFDAGKGAKTIEVEAVLIAVGRGAATDGLELDRWGVRTDRGFILADEKAVAAEGVYAIGDAVAGAPQFAHAAFAMGFAAAERIAGGTPVDLDRERGVPHATYCAPEIASVGLTEEQAKEAGADVKSFKYGFAGNAKANILRQTRGFAKVVADKGGDILGVHMIGPRVTELLSEALLAVGWEAQASDVAAHVHPHPTLSEAIGEAALAAIGRPLHG